ncbi:MAG: N-acetyl-alpha-D-glucosaminyl L-malate synthase BshA [Calditrichia bacterium]
MKIGISCYPTYGGSGVVATELGKNLALRGYDVHFIAYALPYRLNEFHPKIFYHEVKVPEYPLFEYPPYALALATKMAEIALFEKLDLIHAHYAIPHAISAYLAKQMVRGQHPLKIITPLHGTDITLVGADPSFTRITRYSIDNSDAVTTVSQYLKEKTVKTFNPEIELNVIPNFVAEHPQQQKVCEDLRKKLSPHGEPILMHLSNFRPVKRVLDVVEVANLVLKEIPVRVVFIGDGPDRFAAERLVREYGIAEQVLFLGKQEEVYLLLSVADIFIMPSGSESFGLAALEAMSCGIPCITSDAGGLPEVNKHGYSGYIAPLGAVKRMSQYIIELLKNRRLLKTFSKNAREHAFKNFHVDNIMPKYLKLYKKVISL